MALHPVRGNHYQAGLEKQRTFGSVFFRKNYADFLAGSRLFCTQFDPKNVFNGELHTTLKLRGVEELRYTSTFKLKIT